MIRFRFAEVVAQNKVEKVVIISVRGDGKLTCVRGQLRIIRAKADQHIEYVVGRQMRSTARQPDGNSQFIETQTFSSRYPPQFFGSFAVKRRFGINQNVKQTRLVFGIESIQEELNPIGQKLFKVRINRIIDAAQTANRLAFAGDLQRQTGRTIRTDHGLSLQRFNLVAAI